MHRLYAKCVTLCVIDDSMHMTLLLGNNEVWDTCHLCGPLLPRQIVYVSDLLWV